jgi:transposase
MASQDPSKEKIPLNPAPEPSIEAWMATADTLRPRIEPILLEPYSGRGRPPYPPFNMFKALLYRTRITSLRQLCRKLKADKRLFALTGLPRVPPHQTFSVFINRLGDTRFKDINDLLIQELKKIWPDLGRIVSVDGTVVKGWAKNNLRKRSTTDPDARFGFKEKILDKPFFVFGYRATIACDAEREIPLLTIVTPANANECRLYPTILRQTKDLGIDFRVVTADRLFDSRRNLAITLGYGAIPIIGLNTRGSAYAKRRGRRRGDVILPIQRNTEEWQHYYAMRSASERVFASLKEQLGFTTLKARRLARVASFFLLCVIGKLLSALTAARLGRSDLSRSVLAWSY